MSNFSSEIKNIHGVNELHIKRKDHPSQIFWLRNKNQAKELMEIIKLFIAKENIKEKKEVLGNG